MKSVLISIQPRWCHKIIDGEKTIEVRKSKPKLDTPFKVYIYCSAGSYEWSRDPWATAYFPPSGECTNMSQKVIGEFVCDCMTPLYNVCTDDWRLLHGGLHKIEKQLVGMACLTEGELHEYASGRHCFAWHISDLKIYDKPKELNEFVAVDKEAIRQCEHRLQNYYAFTDTGYIKNGFRCSVKDDWCFGCKKKSLTRPPQSWCYVEELS